MGKKDKGANMSGAISAMESRTPNAYNMGVGAFGNTIARWNPSTQTVDQQINANPLINQAITQRLEENVGMDQGLSGRREQARTAYYDPMVQQSRNQLGSFFNRGGASARGNSAFQNAMGNFAYTQGLNQAKDLMGIEDQASNQYLSELSNKQQIAYRPFDYLMSQAMGGQLGSQRAGVGQQAGQMMAQAEMQRAQAAQNKGSGLGSLIGKGLSALGSKYLTGGFG